MRDWAVHADYLIWVMTAVKSANDAWRSRRPYRGETVIDREGMHYFVFHWAVSEGHIKDPGERDMPYSYYVALLYRTHPEIVMEGAREYWRCKAREALAHA